MSAHRARRRYRAPQSDRSWLLALSDETSPQDIPHDRAQPAKISAALRAASETAISTHGKALQQSIAGLPLFELRREAREELLELALAAELQSVHVPATETNASAPLIMTGHQPTLFHPGVWAKNFAADRIARMAGGRSVNLVVDTDRFDERGIRVPTHEGHRTWFRYMNYDALSDADTYVDSCIADEAMFASFGSRVSDHMRSQWGITPLIESNWADAKPRRPHEPLGNCISRMRNSQELRWGLGDHEVLLSQLATTTAFRRFFLDIVRRADEFLEIHNRAVTDYRHAHKLRSQSHPVPLLQRDGDRIELPFWTWEPGEWRFSMYATRGPDSIELSATLYDTSYQLAEIPLQPSVADGDILFKHLLSKGQRVAPRALTTTLFCRVWLADLFIHGIGGAVYDQMTDALIEHFYGLEPPPFFVVTGTLHHPIGDLPRASADEVRRQQRLIRELEHQPERHVSDPPPELLAEKQRLIAEENSRREATLTREERRALRQENHRRWLRLKEINVELAATLADRRSSALSEYGKMYQSRFEARYAPQSREFSAWLYPEPMLRKFFGTLTE